MIAKRIALVALTMSLLGSQPVLADDQAASLILSQGESAAASGDWRAAASLFLYVAPHSSVRGAAQDLRSGRANDAIFASYRRTRVIAMAAQRKHTH